MPECKLSADGKRCETQSEARLYGFGGFWYHWIPGSERTSLKDVKSIFIMMPVFVEGPDPTPVAMEWTISHKNSGGHQWRLTGSLDKPTAHPSLHAVGLWHGWLKVGNLQSC